MESNIVKKKDDIINNPNSNKERKHDSSYEKLQQDIDYMTTKFEALKIEHELELR